MYLAPKLQCTVLYFRVLWLGAPLLRGEQRVFHLYRTSARETRKEHEEEMEAFNMNGRDPQAWTGTVAFSILVLCTVYVQEDGDFTMHYCVLCTVLSFSRCSGKEWQVLIQRSSSSKQTTRYWRLWWAPAG